MKALPLQCRKGGGKRKTRWVIRVCLWAAVALLGFGSTEATAQPPLVFFDGKLRLSGFIENLSIMNTDGFSETVLTQFRNTAQLETEAFLLRDWGLLHELKFDATTRFWYDPAFHLNTTRFGVGAKDKLIGTGPLKLLMPVNPNSSRGKVRLYSNKRRSELEWSTRESYRETMREMFVDITTKPLWGEGLGNVLFFRIGKQQVVWGKTDFFRLEDIINPIDFERHAFVEPFEDIRIPQWILHAVYRFGPRGPFQDLSLELDWNFDRFIPSQIGQGGTPYAHPFGDETRGFRLLFQEGIPPLEVPPGVMGLRRVILPDHTIGNTQWGGRVQGVWRDITWSVNYWHGWQDLPLFRLVPSPIDPVFIPLLGPKGGKAPLYDMRFFRREVVGGSFDWFEQWTQSVWRGELTYAFSEHINNTKDLADAIDTSDVLRFVAAWDRPTFIRPLNRTRTFLLSAQSFFTYITDHEGTDRGPGFVQDQWQVTLTFLALGFYYGDRILPVFFAGYQFSADAILAGGWVQYLYNDHIDVTLGMNSISGRHKFFDTGAGGGGLLPPQSEVPWGPAKEGFGAWRQVDDFWLKVRYRF